MLNCERREAPIEYIYYSQPILLKSVGSDKCFSNVYGLFHLGIILIRHYA